MADPYPVYSEFKNNPPVTASGKFKGCAVATCASLLQRYKGIKTTNLTTLGRSMGARHRKVDPKNRCGLGEHGWCNYCIFLELKAHGIPAVYRKLTWAQVVGQLKAKHACALAIWYGDIPRVSKTSYDSDTPARGRSDGGYIWGHSIAAYGTYVTNGTRKIIAADPDFGSSSRPRIPPHSVLAGPRVRTSFNRLKYGVCYVSKAPPAA